MYYFFGKAMIVLVGFWWCIVILGRLPSDIKEFRRSDYTGKVPIIIIWLFTVCIVIWLVRFICGWIETVGRYFF